MAQPTIWPKKTWFYPVGNTTPQCFTQDLSPEQDAHILLLACGDPRSILYTVFADLSTCRRKLDFTCADWQPGVLARNILLFCMIVDGIDPMVIFSTFYNFFINQKAVNTIVQLCNRLENASVDLQTWNASKYGQLVRFTTRHSLETIRLHWSLYKETAESSKKNKEQLKSTFLASMKAVFDKHGDLNPLGSATGPICHIYYSTKQDIRSYRELWTTGVVSSTLFKDSVKNIVNPTFVHSLDGNSFDVHYGTNPLKSFFLAPALASTEQSSLPASDLTGYVQSCIAQFSNWCHAFKARCEGQPGTVTIRVFVGEALAFCRALRYCKDDGEVNTGAYTYPWGGTQVVFETCDYGANVHPSAPTSFNVIDTSNITDHCGLLNLLTATIPLLCHLPSSTIHTHTLLPAYDGNATSGLQEKAFADLPTLSIILGIAPKSFTSHFMTASNRHVLGVLLARQIPEEISWKLTSSVVAGPNILSKELRPSALEVDSDSLSHFLLTVYHKMFAEENHKDSFLNISIATVRKADMILYQRSSFVSLIQLIKGRINTDWDRTISSLLDLIAGDRTLLMGAHSFQELVCQLRLQGLHPANTGPIASTVVHQKVNRLSGWSPMPAVVCIVLRVPRTALTKIEELPLENIGTPALQCETGGLTFHNMHPSIQPIFGNINVRHVDGEDIVDIIEDTDGFKGKSDLIITFHIPSIWVITEPSMPVGLHIRTSPSTIMLVRHFGLRLTLFSTTMDNREYIQVVRHRPNNPAERVRLQRPPKWQEVHGLSSQVTLALDNSKTRIVSMSMKDVVEDPKEVSSLRAGAQVLARAVTDCGILVTFESYQRIFVFPYPVHGGACKTRIARKSSYIEIECPVRADFSDTNNLSLNLFPVSSFKRSLNLLNVHYVNLDVLPTLRMRLPKTKLEWLSTHIAMAFSDDERSRIHEENPVIKGALVDLKESITACFQSFAGLKPSPDADNKRSQILGLTNPAPGIKTYTLIFVNDIKLDLAGHTVVLDACVVPLTDPLVERIGSLLVRLVNEGLCQYRTLDGEMRLWRQLLVAASERCRTWNHTPNCEYLSEGVPRILDGVDTSPLCSCGRGKNLGAFGDNAKWKMVHKEATRIAIGPLFSHSFLDDIKLSTSRLSAPTSSTSNPQYGGSGGGSDRCAKCSKTSSNALQVCSRCKKAKYCSRECQTTHWKAHKPHCNSS